MIMSMLKSNKRASADFSSHYASTHAPRASDTIKNYNTLLPSLNVILEPLHTKAGI